ncbi:MAG: FAD-binding protein, partial [Phycisphaerae bacterium]|nr:FAD-binding protein [Phycisphaerae bacterium]
MNLNVVGGGLTGLAASIDAAERGWRVTVHEARSTLGGRAATLNSAYRANRGPHALYADGPLWSWLQQRGLTPSTVSPSGETLFRVGGQVQPLPPTVGQAIATLPPTAPVDQTFRAWLNEHIDDTKTVEAVIGLTFIVTYHHDPGQLSAAFVHERLRRGGSHVRYVEGGWGQLIDSLAHRATELGVEVRHRAPMTVIPHEPTLLTATMSAARHLTQDPSLHWTGSRVALVDLGLSPHAAIGWFRIFDLDHRIYAARYTHVDPSLAPPGHHLIQIAASIEPGE